MSDVTLELRDGSKFVCPENMVPDSTSVLNGEYSVPVDFSSPPSVLDIGACCGAFARWAVLRWPGAIVTSYEPHPTARHYAELNLAPGVTVWPCAVGEYDGDARLHTGQPNLGCSSMHRLIDAPDNIGDAHVLVRVAASSSLPGCDVLKIDAEGCELDILRGYDLGCTKLVLLEFHRREDRHAIERE